MPEVTEPKSRHWYGNYSRVSAAILLALVLYTGWTMYRRFRGKRAAEAAATAAQRAKEQEEAARTYETLGGSEFGILNFYVLPKEIRRGESATMCYGVSNARSVRLDPRAEEVWPSLSRCFDVSPKKTTTYTLTIEDAAGHTKTSAVTLEVR